MTRAGILATVVYTTVSTSGLGCSAFVPEIGGIRKSSSDAAADVRAIAPEGGDLGDAAFALADGAGAAEGAPFPGDDASANVDSGPRTWTVVVGPNGVHAFDPSALVIGLGDTVHWAWQTSGHTVISGSGSTADGRFCSPADTRCQNAPYSGAGASYEHTFSAAGDFPYFCAQHSGMAGSVTVQ